MAIKTIFLDRDGVINKEINYLFKIEDFEFIEGVFETCSHFLKLGFQIVIITNQSGISRGYYSENDFMILTMAPRRGNDSPKIITLNQVPNPESGETNLEARSTSEDSPLPNFGFDTTLRQLVFKLE